MKKIFTKNKEEKTKEGTIASLVSSSNNIAVKLATELVISEEVENAGSQSETKEWKDIHEDFTPELQKDWEKKGFSYEDTKKWIEVGLEVEDAECANWLKNVGKLDAEQYNLQNIRNLKKQYNQFGTCLECNKPNTGGIFFNADSRLGGWCKSCNSRHFKDEFENWTSGNELIDKYIQKSQLEASSWEEVLEWIPYEKFTDIEYLAKGGFGKLYKSRRIDGIIIYWDTESKSWKRIVGSRGVVLKVLHNSQNITSEFLQEIANHKLFSVNFGEFIAPCQGISQDPKTKEYIMVVPYMEGGSLREYLKKSSNRLDPWLNLFRLFRFSSGLNSIHKRGLIHKDFHPGNLLIGIQEHQDAPEAEIYSISDLGLCRPANEPQSKKVFGVLPYVAPEVLRGQPYTQASDVYSLGIIAYELLVNSYPYAGLKLDDTKLALAVCKGLRPKVEELLIPQLLKDLIKRCWDNAPEQRPTANELERILHEWVYDVKNQRETEFYQQYKEAQTLRYYKLLSVIYKKHIGRETKIENEVEAEQIGYELLLNFERSYLSTFDHNSYSIRMIKERTWEEFNNWIHLEINNIMSSYQTHPQAVYTSRLINTKQITQQLEKLKNDEEYHTKSLEELTLSLDSLNLDELTIQEDLQEQSSTQAQIQIPPKK